MKRWAMWFFIYPPNLNLKVATWNDKVKLFEFDQMKWGFLKKKTPSRLKEKLVKKKKQLRIIFLKYYFIKNKNGTFLD